MALFIISYHFWSVFATIIKLFVEFEQHRMPFYQYYQHVELEIKYILYLIKHTNTLNYIFQN